jgi:hypothetical protein
MNINDSGLEDAIQTTEGVVQQSTPEHDEATPVETGGSAGHSGNSPKPPTEKISDVKESNHLPEVDRSRIQIPGNRRKHRHHGRKRIRKQYTELDEDEASIYQPTYVGSLDAADQFLN